MSSVSASPAHPADALPAGTPGPPAPLAERREARRTFWHDALAVRGSVTLQVVPVVLAFGGLAAGLVWVFGAARARLGVDLRLEVSPHEIAGAVLALLLVLRTNSGYDRWWEARKLWGGIVNQSRNLAISALAYGPARPAWRAEVVAWAAAFPHAARASLRGEGPPPEAARLVGADGVRRLAAADHMPTMVALHLAQLLRTALPREHARVGDDAMDRFAFVQVDRERAMLIDHLGGCERILKTPLPRGYAIQIRRFLVLFLGTLPAALLSEIDSVWLVPLVTMAVAYPLLALDRLGEELQNPFSVHNVNHLPLDDISATIERNLRALLPPAPPAAPTSDGVGAAPRALHAHPVTV